MMATLKKLGIKLDSDAGDRLLIGMSDFSCNSCNILLLLVAPSFESDFPSEHILFCFSCSNEKRIVDLPVQQQNLIIDKYNLIKENGFEKNSLETVQTIMSFYKLLNDNDQKSMILDKNKMQSSKSLDKKSQDFIPSSDAPIPKGFRSVAWLRNYEAEAIIYAYESKSNFDFTTSDGKIIFKCLYFSDKSKERIKFKSNIQAIRINNQNQRVIGWIRIEEAQAVIESNKKKQDIDFKHLNNGNGGRIQFFPEESSISKKYKSTTRLLRKD